MQASLIGPVKMMLRSIDTRAVRACVEKLCTRHGASGGPS